LFPFSIWGEAPFSVNIIRDIPSTLPYFEKISIDMELFKKLLPMSATIALVSFMESIAVGKTMETQRKKL
jgi:MFS superfamily sulfate permease-like transporter